MKWLALFLALLTPTTGSAVYAQDSTAVGLTGVAVWDIEFHFITTGGDYIQLLLNPHNEEQEAIGIFSDGIFSAYYFRVENGHCYTGLRFRYERKYALPAISPSSCDMFNFYDEQIWLIRSGIDRKRLEHYSRGRIKGA